MTMTMIETSNAPVPDEAAPVLMIPARLTAPSYARRYVRRQLRTRGLDRFIDDAALIVSELIANAVEASTSDQVSIEIGTIGNQVLIRVGNDGHGIPEPVKAGALDGSGYGLLIVSALSVRWGYVREDTEQALTVWVLIG